MKKIQPMHDYILRLCTTGREKSLLGIETEAAEYFIKAIDLAESFEDFLSISKEIYRSDLSGNKLFAYTCFLKALEVSAEPVRQYKKMFYRKDLAFMVSEFFIKMPDHLYHFLMNKCMDDSERESIAFIFQPQSNFISDPDPVFFLGSQLKNAS